MKTTGQASSSARKCGFPNGTVNLSNVGVYGTCGRCGKHEHFRCAKIKEEEKEEIVKGCQSFYCSGCLFKHPQEVSYCKPLIYVEEIPRIEIANNAPETDDTENSIEVVAVVYQNNETPPACYQCEVCEYNVDFEQEIKRHMDEKHGRFKCETCEKTFWDSDICTAQRVSC